MTRSRCSRVLIMAFILTTSGCGFFRERLCCRETGSLMSRFRGQSPAYTIDNGMSGGFGDCGCDTNGMMGGPILGTPSGPIGTPGNVLPIPKIQEKSGEQKEYIPGMNIKQTKPLNEAKNSREGI